MSKTASSQSIIKKNDIIAMNELGIPPETFFLILNLLSSQQNVFAKTIGALEQELVRMLRLAIS